MGLQTKHCVKVTAWTRNQQSHGRGRNRTVSLCETEAAARSHPVSEALLHT
jgi:hypothetical protein